MSEGRQELAARLVVGLAGSMLADAERAWLAQWRPAGVILFHRNVPGVEPLRRLVADLRSVLPAGAEICADHEGGPVSFLQPAAGRPPAARTLGDIDDPDLTRRVHRETGERLLSLGLDRVLAPCCDVLTESRNPVIGARAFGADAVITARHAVAAVAGLKDAGLRGCAKHWPGHGGSAVDTHRDAVAADPDQDPGPFDAALDAGLDAVMVGHLPVADGRPPLPLDAEGLRDLRDRVGSGRLILSDDVSMGALRAPLAQRGVRARDGRDEGLADPADLPLAWLTAVADAGCDRLLLRGIPWGALSMEDDNGGVPLPEHPPAPDLAAPGPDAAVYAEARRRAASGLRLAPGDAHCLWLDLTGADRLGSAAGLEPALRTVWPRLDRLDAAAPRLAPGRTYGALVVSTHRPLTTAAAALLEPLSAALGQALVLGHPSLSGDVTRLLGPGWTVGALRDVSAADLAPLGGLA